jgi:hypothetical protein
MKPYEDENGDVPLREWAIVGHQLFQIYVPRTPPRCFSYPVWAEQAVRAWGNSWDEPIWPASEFLRGGYAVPTCLSCSLN